MKIHFNPKDIFPKLRLAKAATVKSTTPILENVKIVANKESGAVLHATDLALGIRIRFKCKVTEDGAAILPVKRLIAILASTKASQISLASTNTGIALECDGEEYTFFAQSPDEFPDVSDFNAESYHEILAFSMQAMIQQTVFATDKEDVRLALAGVCFESDQRIVTAVSTDGRQLAWQSATGATVGKPKIDTAIVPAKTLALLDKILQDKSVKRTDKVKMAADVKVNGDRQTSGTVLFQCGDFTLFSRLQEGRYPKWRGIVPKTEDKTCATVHCGDLRTAVNNVKGVVTNLEPGIYLMFDKGQLTLIGQGKEVGKTKKTISLTYNGRKRTFKVDESFLTAYLKVLDAKTKLSVYLPEGAGEPIQIRCTDDHLYVVMPMSYKDEELPTECRDIAESECHQTAECEPEVPVAEPDVEAASTDYAEVASEAGVESEPARAVPKVQLPKKIIYHIDPGHGWLAVKRSLIEALGIAQDISSFSYQRGDTVYLEEDSDAGCFFEAMIAAGYSSDQLHERTEERSLPDHHSPIRSYDSYTPSAKAAIKPVEVKASKPPTIPATPAQPRPVNGGKSAVIQRESGESVSGTIRIDKQRGCIVFEAQESGKLYRIPTHGCKKRSREGVTYVSISEAHLLANAHLLGMFTSGSLF